MKTLKIILHFKIDISEFIFFLMERRLLMFVLGLMLCASLHAQQTVTGTIADNAGNPLVGAKVLVKGTPVGVYTNEQGQYSVDVPGENTTLIVSYFGYTPQEVTTSGAITDIVLVEEDYTLEQVVLTGLGIKREKKALGYGVSTISTEQVERRAEADIARILRGKATGVDITQTSGLAGSGTNVIIRGYSSITGSNQPLFVVDGVPFNTSTNNDRNFLGGGATASSRFLDLDPNNVADISILKGLSATVLYGEAGRNGVILITTKNGQAGEKASRQFDITFTQSIAVTEVANIPDYQNTFGNGFSGDFGWFYSNWGPSFDTRGANGVDANGTVNHPYDQVIFNDDFPELVGARYDYQAYESVENFFQQGFQSNSSVSLEKRLNDNSSFNFNYAYLSDAGYVPEDKNVLRKHNFGIGGQTELANGLKVKATFNYVDLNRETPPAAAAFGGTSVAGRASLFSDVLYTPRSIDLINLPYESPIDGSNVYYRRSSDIQNPLWTLNNASDDEILNRFFGAVNLNYDLADWLSVNYRIGIDQFTHQQRRKINKGGTQIPLGQLTTSERFNRIADHVLNFTYMVNITDDLALDGILGGNVRRTSSDATFSSSSQQLTFDLFRHQNFVEHNVSSATGEENTLGIYLTSSLSYKNYLFLNVQARNDWTSTLERENRSILYPSASVAFVPSDAFDFLNKSRFVDFLKVRVGYGTSAGYPSPYQTRNILAQAANAFITRDGTVVNLNAVSDQLGNPNLRPELHAELELGIEGRFWQNRLGIDISMYNKNSTDLIVDLSLDPATGASGTTINAAEINNKGIEVGFNIVPVRNKFIWDVNLNFTAYETGVVKIADQIDQIPFAGFLDLGNFAVAGKPYGVMYGSYYQRVNGEFLVDDIGNYIVSQDIQEIGDPNPDWSANWINRLSYAGLSFEFQWSFIMGGDIYSRTTATLLARGNTVDTEDNRDRLVVLPGVTNIGTDENPNYVPNTTQGYMGDIFFENFFGSSEASIFDGTSLRLREIALSYSLPKSIMERLPFGDINIRVAGENLWYEAFNFPDGINFDPEVLSLGVGNGRGFDFLTGPTAKKYGVNISMTF